MDYWATERIFSKTDISESLWFGTEGLCFY